VSTPGRPGRRRT